MIRKQSFFFVFLYWNIRCVKIRLALANLILYYRMNSQKIVRLNRRIYKKRVRYWLTLFHGIGKCTYGSGASTRIAIAILAKFNVPLNFWQSAGFALFYGIGKCTYGSGASTRIAIAILAKFNVPLNFWQSAGFALFYV